jgi:hypothetical protein
MEDESPDVMLAPTTVVGFEAATTEEASWITDSVSVEAVGSSFGFAS